MKPIYICITLLLSTIITSNSATAGYAGTHDGQPNRAEKLLFKAIGAAVVGAGALAYKEHKAREIAGEAELDATKDDNAECPPEAQNGPYYRYELDTQFVIQARETGWLYGRPIAGVGLYPYVKAYMNRHLNMSHEKLAGEIKFCTPAIGHIGGHNVILFGEKDQGVIIHDEDTVKIPIIVLY